MELVFDVETDGLYLDAKNIWCLVAVDEHDKVYSFKPDEINKGIDLLKSADKIIGHNIIGFDIPVIKKLTGVDLYKHTEVLDTLTLSRLFHPTREGGHSLEKWGYKLNYLKSEQPEFDSYSDDMLEYCLRDVTLNKKVLNYLRKESVGFSKECIEIEHKVCRILQEQYENGFLFDEKNAMFLLGSLNKRKQEVEKFLNHDD